MLASECREALGRERVDITPENPLSWCCQAGGIACRPGLTAQYGADYGKDLGYE
jgi:hypothetical protein